MTEPAGIEPGSDFFADYLRSSILYGENHIIFGDGGPEDVTEQVRAGTFEVRKIAAVFQIPEELLHPERYPAPAVTWRDRARWRWWEVKDRISLAWEVLRKGRDGIHSSCDY